MTKIEAIIEDCRLMRADHEPHGWPAIIMKDITALCDEVERLQSQLAIAMGAIEEISVQRLPEEMDEEDRERADFFGGYSGCVYVARSAQAKMRGKT